MRRLALAFATGLTTFVVGEGLAVLCGAVGFWGGRYDVPHASPFIASVAVFAGFGGSFAALALAICTLIATPIFAGAAWAHADTQGSRGLPPTYGEM